MLRSLAAMLIITQTSQAKALNGKNPYTQYDYWFVFVGRRKWLEVGGIKQMENSCNTTKYPGTRNWACEAKQNREVDENNTGSVK